jgi:pheophorbide a oxygenase
VQGWRFDGCGACAGIPQDGSSRPAGAPRAAHSPRAAAAAFPTAVAQGLLYVWPTAGDFDAARTAPLPLVPGLNGAPGGPPVVERGVPYVRDLLYGLDTLIENLADPGHVAWAHHGIVARTRMSRACFMQRCRRRPCVG